MSKSLLILFVTLVQINCATAAPYGQSEKSKSDYVIREVKNRYNLDIQKKKNRLTLYNQILKWEGVPYKTAGRDTSGIDCSGFVSAVFKHAYKRKIAGPAKSIFEESKQISKNDLQEGDLVFFKIEQNQVSHIGIYLKDSKFAHASVKKGVIVSSLNEPYYRKYFFKGGRI